jgi:hypothetical protein
MSLAAPRVSARKIVRNTALIDVTTHFNPFGNCSGDRLDSIRENIPISKPK